MAGGLLSVPIPRPNPRRGLGLLSPAGVAASGPSPSFADRFNTFAGDNWETLLAMGLGGLQPTAAASTAGMLQGLGLGSQMSDRRRDRQDEQKERERVLAEKQAVRTALAGALKQYSGELDPATMALMEASPEWGMQWLSQQMDPTGDYKVVGDNMFNTRSGEWITPPVSAGGGPFEGNGMDQQSWNIILRGETDSPEYAAAYNTLFEQPRMQSVQTAQGLQLIPVMPQVPASVRPPASRGAGSGPSPANRMTARFSDAFPASTPTPSSQLAQPPSGGVGAPISIPGTEPRPQESMIRDRKLLTLVEPEFEKLRETYSSLAELGNQVAGAIPVLGNFVVSPEYQEARGQVQAIAQSYLYSLSGATAPVEEVNKIMASVMPVPGDGAQTIRDKLARLGQYVEAIRSGANGGAVPDLRQQTGGGWTPLPGGGAIMRVQ